MLILVYHLAVIQFDLLLHLPIDVLIYLSALFGVFFLIGVVIHLPLLDLHQILLELGVVEAEIFCILLVYDQIILDVRTEVQHFVVNPVTHQLRCASPTRNAHQIFKPYKLGICVDIIGRDEL